MGKGSDEQVVTNRVDVPSWLEPLARQQAGVGRSALSRLSQLTRGDLTAGFTPDQLQAFDMARNVAMGEGGFLPTAQNALFGAAQGSGLSRFVNPAALAALTGSAQGQGLDSFLPTATLEALTQAAQGGGIPSGVTDFLGQSMAQSGVPVEAFDATGQIVSGQLLPQQTLDTLTRTAQGDFLMGGEGFDEAVSAAVRAAQPQILSTFGRGGAGAATGGLAQAAIGQAASDAFARQFAQERQNQLSAANALGSLGLSEASQRLAGAGQLADMGLAGQAQQLQAAGLLGTLGPNQQIQAAGLLGDFASQERARQLGSAGQLAGLSDAERQRQLAAAQALPGIGLFGSDILSRIGGMQQAQSQQELMAPIMAQQQLLSAMGGGVPLGALLGSTQTQPMQSNTFGNILGGAATGFQMFGPWGALGGGILGALG